MARKKWADVDMENKAIRTIENLHLKREPNQTYIALENMELAWELSEVEQFIILWNDGTPLKDIATHFNRSCDEVAILLFDLSLNGKVEPRKNGIH